MESKYLIYNLWESQQLSAALQCRMSSNGSWLKAANAFPRKYASTDWRQLVRDPVEGLPMKWDVNIDVNINVSFTTEMPWFFFKEFLGRIRRPCILLVWENWFPKFRKACCTASSIWLVGGWYARSVRSSYKKQVMH